jgi:hypothetical protein
MSSKSDEHIAHVTVSYNNFFSINNTNSFTFTLDFVYEDIDLQVVKNS